MKKSIRDHFRKLKKVVIPALAFSVGLSAAISSPAHAETNLDTEIANMKKVATALGDICTGITNALMVVIGIHYSGKFIKYALG